MRWIGLGMGLAGMGRAGMGGAGMDRTGMDGAGMDGAGMDGAGMDRRWEPWGSPLGRDGYALSGEVQLRRG